LNTLDMLRHHLTEFGRDIATFGLEGWLRSSAPEPQQWAAAADGWRRLGAESVMLYPMYKIANVDEQIATLQRFKEAVGG
jgi:hypothetical protein